MKGLGMDITISAWFYTKCRSIYANRMMIMNHFIQNENDFKLKINITINTFVILDNRLHEQELILIDKIMITASFSLIQEYHWLLRR